MVLGIISIGLRVRGSQGEELDTFAIFQVRAAGGLDWKVIGGDFEKL